MHQPVANTGDEKRAWSDLVEILRQEIVRQQLVTGSPDGELSGVAIWKYAPREVHVELATVVDRRPHIERWSESMEQGSQNWPREFDDVQLLWIGRLIHDPGQSSDWLLRLGPLSGQGLALLVMHCVAWRKGSPAWLEWNGQGPAKVTILEPNRVRRDKDALFDAWRAVDLIAQFDTELWHGGRPSEASVWAREFAEKWREFEVAKHRPPKQREMADAMGHSLDYLKTRFRQVIGKPTGVTWDTYKA